tara:strand:- start:9892 stop:10047 length:156 start_codon:yes stop_codon:yes gene_type:complete
MKLTPGGAALFIAFSLSSFLWLGIIGLSYTIHQSLQSTGQINDLTHAKRNP